MEKRQKPLKTLISVAVVSIITTSAAYSAGFSLYSETAAGSMGNYSAGSAAEAADASIGWYNPAGLVLIRETQVASGGTGIFPSASITGSSTFRTPGLPNYVQTFSNLQASNTNAFVPSFHAAMPIGDRATVGLSMVSPFGLATDWDADSPVRYDATFAELITLNVSPEIGGRITDNFSVGGGIDFQYARVKFNSMLGAPTFFQAFPGLGSPTRADSESYNKGKSYGIGFHAGVMGMFNQNHTRVGLNYQSKVKHTFYGFSNLRGFLATNTDLLPPPAYVTAGQFTSDDLFSNEIALPDVVTLSGYHDVNEKFAILGSVVYTNWSVFKQIDLNKVAAPALNSPVPLAISQVYVNSKLPQNFRNAWRASLGMNYHVNKQWMLRAGTGYDQTPTNNVDRSVRLPDADRYALAVGAHYQMRPNIGFDLGYTHLFGENGEVNSSRTLGTSTFNVNAATKTHADLVGGQVVYAMDSIPVPTK